MATPVISLVLKKLDELLSEEIKLLLGVKQQLSALKTQLTLIIAFLRDIGGKRMQSPELVKAWINQLRDVAYEAEDIIDDFFLEIDQHRHVGFTGCLKNCVICIGETPARHDLGRRIEDIRTEISEIFEQKRNFQIENVVGTASDSANQGPSELDKASIAEGLDVVGFEAPEKEIMDEIFHGEDEVTIISIVGMGGSGKTTITKKVYNRVEVEARFKYRIWITVSRHYNVDELLRNILKGILQCIPRSRHEKQQIANMRDEELLNRIKGHLKSVTYLVVVDDIWDKKAWDYIKTALPADSPGSRVILTTRTIEVAKYAKGKIHELPFLTEKASWELFCMKVFPNADCPSELKEVGTEMVNKCRGLPLAIIILGGLLTGKEQVRYEWQKIRDRLTRELSTERDEMIKNILALSYDDLPYDLKLCFLYVGLFPEDMEIHATKLIQLWVAEGFIEQENGRIMEVTAEEHLEKLANRCILQVVVRDAMGRVSKCRIHDLLLDLASMEGQQNRFLDVHGNNTTIHVVKSRRLAIHQNIGNCFASSKCLTSKLHSLLCFNLHGQDMASAFVVLTLLRVVDIEDAPIEMLPDEIGSMVHLKYLGLRRTKLSSLPSSVKRLYKLETLDILEISGISLPDALWNMKTIRHIHACSVRPHSNCSGLRDLQTLDTATADKWVHMSLGNLTNLRKLGIEGISSSHGKSLSDSIQKLGHLNFLKLEGSSIPNVLGLTLTKHDGLHYLYLKGEMGKIPKLKPGNLPPNLTQITLDGSKLEQDPLALLEGQPYLSTLILSPKSFVGDEMVCSAGGFPRLQELYLSNLTELRHLKMEDGAMKCLKSLTVKDCVKLEELPEALKNVKTLKELTLENMPPEFTEKVAENGIDWHKVQHIPLLNIY